MPDLEKRVESLEKLLSLMRPYLKAPMHGMSLWSNIEERSTDPEDPPEGFGSLWLSDGTEQGDDGDLIFERTAGGVTAASVVNGLVFTPGYYTSTSWDGDAKNGADGVIDLSAVFGVPAGVKAIAARLAVKDETIGVYGALWTTSVDTDQGIAQITQAANIYNNVAGVVECDGNGDVYWEQSGEFDAVFFGVLGYWL